MSVVHDVQALRDELSKLRFRVEELSKENRDLRDICETKGVPYEDALAARRHRRLVDQLAAEHREEGGVGRARFGRHGPGDGPRSRARIPVRVARDREHRVRR